MQTASAGTNFIKSCDFTKYQPMIRTVFPRDGHKKAAETRNISCFRQHLLVFLFFFLLLFCPLGFLLDADNIILPVFFRRHADIFRKLEIKIALGIVTYHTGNCCNRQIGRDKQCLRLADAAAQQILHRGISAHLLEHM